MPQSDQELSPQDLAGAEESFVDYAELSPANPLIGRYVQSCSYSLGLLRERHVKHITRLFPTVMTQLYFEFSGGLSEIELDGERQPVSRRSYLSHGVGGWMDIYQLPSDREARVIKSFKVDLWPNALYEVFGVSPRELPKNGLRVEEVWGPECALMVEQMEAATTGEGMLRIFEKYFLRKLLSGTRKPRFPAARLVAPDATLASLSRSLGCSERWLQKQFVEVFGMSFKQMHGNLRFFDRLRTMRLQLRQNRRVNLSEIASQGDYSDQAHFIKEFRRYTGMTPTAYLDESFQDKTRYLWHW